MNNYWQGNRSAGRVHVFAIAFVLALGMYSSGGVAQSSLPPEVQADMLKTQIFEALKHEDVTTALSAFDKYRHLKVTIPPPLLFLEAKAAAMAKDPVRALNSLEEFLKVSAREGKQYGEALALYPQYQTSVQAAERQLAEQQRLAEEVKRAAALEKAATLLPAIQGNMRTIPAGTFRMGDISGKGSSDERPVHGVTLKSFRLAADEVTFDQYDIFAAATGRTLPADAGWGRGTRPVINVSWDDAKAFIAWLNQQGSGAFRLPSESEWEYAARAGSSTDYPWGAAFSADQANGSGTSGGDHWDHTAPVGAFPANAFGLHDMIGNVWEWTEDCFEWSYAGAPSDGSARISSSCGGRVARGGSWSGDPTFLRVSYRGWLDAAYRYYYLGFRLAQDL